MAVQPSVQTLIYMGIALGLFLCLVGQIWRAIRAHHSIAAVARGEKPELVYLHAATRAGLIVVSVACPPAGIVFGLALPLLFYVMNLTTEVREDGLYYRLFPFHWSFQSIGGSDIDKFESITYRPLRDYGGWGIRYGFNGKAYNVSGNRGVQLQLRDGRQVLIGSRKPEDLADALQLIIRQS